MHYFLHAIKQNETGPMTQIHSRTVTALSSHPAKPVLDNKPPLTYMHLHLKLKKLQVEEERLAIIERDNRILLEKMCYIMRTRGRVDNTNDYEQKRLVHIFEDKQKL